MSKLSQTAEEVKSGKRPAVKLAVDGYAMLYYLYFSHNFNCVCGGQYFQFAEYARTYISNLLKCGFSPFVSLFTEIRACMPHENVGRQS